ncbi:hypothetical protein AX15_002229 [Amanita polypyramis BW_CC]|nr:hypothetical protein AX15_002229 [Amanita polypyramis BW_CC]
MEQTSETPRTEASATSTLTHDGSTHSNTDNTQASSNPRASTSSRPSPDGRDSTLPQDKLAHNNSSRPQSGVLEEKRRQYDAEEPIYLEFEEGDKRNPVNYPKIEKWIITVIACIVTLLSSSTASMYPPGFHTMIPELNCSYLEAITGLSVYALGFGVAPLVTASLSEEFGRRPLYIVSQIIFLVMYAMVGFAKNVQTVILGRLIQGAAGSTGATMVGGTIADIWSPDERGIPMAAFTLTALGGVGVGSIVGSWIEMNRHLGWRWIQWIQMAYCGLIVFLVLFMKETRSAVILIRLAAKARKETGSKRYRTRVEEERGSLLSLIKVSCTRPVYLTFTEPIVLAFSLWIGFAWAVTFSFISVISLVFEDVHHFSIGLAGTTYVSMIIGSCLGLVTNFYQQYLYQRGVAKRGPEARLYMACLAGVMLPAGLFIFAWTSLEHVHWIGLNFGITIFTWSIYIIYQTVFSYLSDCYGPWASSAAAGQSLARNLMATAFPLFTRQMFLGLTFKWAGTVFAFIGLLLMPIPFVLFFWGPAVRKRSRVASKLGRV